MDFGRRVDPGDVAEPSASVHRFDVSDGLLLLDRSTNSLFAFNETARHVWDLIESGKSASSTISEFAQAWQIPTAVAERDVGSIFAQWRACGLLAGSDRREVHDPPIGDTKANLPSPAREFSEWTCTIRGIPIAVASDTALIGPIRELFRVFETPGVAPRSRIEIRFATETDIVLVEDGRERLRTDDWTEATGALYIAILETIHPGVRWFALIHGSALARGNDGIALAGPSGSGKSTLTAALMAAGFDYLSDDLIALAEPDGVIVPWPLPLSIKPGSADIVAGFWPELAKASSYPTKGMTARLLIPAAGAWDSEPVKTRRIFFPRYAAGAQAESMRLSSFQVVERLLKDRMWLGSPITEERVTAFLAWLQDTPAYALTYPDLDSAMRLIEDALT